MLGAGKWMRKEETVCQVPVGAWPQAEVCVACRACRRKRLACFDSHFSLFVSKINVYFTFVTLRVFRNMEKKGLVLVLTLLAFDKRRGPIC